MNFFSWDRLYSEAREKRNSRASLHAEAVKERIRRELQACSFQPKTNPTSSAAGEPRAARIVKDFGKTTERLQNAWKKAQSELLADDK